MDLFTILTILLVIIVSILLLKHLFKYLAGDEFSTKPIGKSIKKDLDKILKVLSFFYHIAWVAFTIVIVIYTLNAFANNMVDYSEETEPKETVEQENSLNADDIEETLDEDEKAPEQYVYITIGEDTRKHKLISHSYYNTEMERLVTEDGVYIVPCNNFIIYQETTKEETVDE